MANDVTDYNGPLPYLNRATLKRRGWTDGLIADLLGTAGCSPL